MSKSKKLLSVLLALVMVLTTAVVGFSAFAADDERAPYDEYVANFEPTKVEFPENLSEKGDMTKLVNALLDMVAGFIPPESGVDLNNLDKLLADGVYTNYTIGMITTLYDMIAQMIAGSGDFTTTMLLGNIFDPIRLTVSKAPDAPAQWAHLPKVVEKLAEATKAALDAGEDFKVDKNGNPTLDKDGNKQLNVPTVAYNYVEWESGDWGFEDGDRDGFIKALSVALRPVFSALFEGTIAASLIPFSPDARWNNFQAQSSNPVYVDQGLYADLFLILESLGADAMPVEEYSMNYLNTIFDENKPAGYKGAPNNNGINGYNWAATDMLSKPILDAVFSILDKALADPTQFLADVLVNLAFLVEVGGVDGVVSTIVEKMNNSVLKLVLADADIPELTGDGINELLTAAPISIPLDEAGETVLTLQLKPIDWHALANCATVEVVKSGLYDGAYTIKRTADFDKAFATLFYYLYDTIADDANFDGIKTALSTLLPAELVETVVGILDSFKEMGSVKALGALGEMFLDKGDDGDEPPVVNPDPDIPPTGMIF